MIHVEKYISDLIVLLKQYFGPRLLYVGLQGSYLRGEATANSDIDVMVVLDSLTVSDLEQYRIIISLGGNFALERYPLLLAAIAAFIAAPISCLIGAALVHAMSRLFGARQPFHATLRAIGYSATPLILGVIPICGAAAGSILCLVHASIGIAQLQRLTAARAIALLLLTPVVFSCFAGLAFVAGVQMFVSQP